MFKKEGIILFTTKTIKIFDTDILYPNRRLHIWVRNGYDDEMLKNDIWHFEYDAKIDWVSDYELSLTNIDYNCCEIITLDSIENCFVKMELQ